MIDAMLELLGEKLKPLIAALLFAVGWPVVKLLTLGRNPRPGIWRSYCMEAQWVRGAGMTLAHLPSGCSRADA